jgi:hypothetical protein
VNDPLHSFRRIPLHVEVPNNYFLKIKRKQLTLDKQPSPKKKQQRGIQSLNKMQEGIIRIIAQYVGGFPVEPKDVLSKW